MFECLPDFPRYVRQAGDLWEGADRPDGPWRTIPASQSGLPWEPSRRGSNPPPPASPPTADLALRVQRLEARCKTERAALRDAFRQIDELKRRLDFQYSKLYRLEESMTLRPMTDPTPLSPAAQAIVQAFDDRYENCGPFDDWQEVCLAVALRAVADQVVPPDPCGNDCCITQCEQIRAELLAIAAELEGSNG